MERLDSTIWSRLPTEIKCRIIDHSDFETLSSWSATCFDFFRYATERIWRELYIERPDGYDTQAFLQYLSKSQSDNRILGQDDRMFTGAPQRNETHCQTQQPSNDPRRSQLAAYPLPPDRVKHVIVDYRAHRTIHGGSGNITIYDICQGVEGVSLVGPLCGCQVQLMLALRKLSVLHMRMRNTPSDYMALNCRLPRRQKDYVLDLQTLSKLQNLKILHIGRLCDQEADGLALAAQNLQIQKLVIISGNHDFHDDKREGHKWCKASRRFSPLVIFLIALQPAPVLPVHFQKGGLPATLKSLYLKDSHHYTRSPLIQMVAKAITQCSMLESLEIVCRITNDTVNLIESTGMPVECSFITIPTWSHLSIEEGMKIIRISKDHVSGEYDVPDHGQRVHNIARTIDVCMESQSDADMDNDERTLFEIQVMLTQPHEPEDPIGEVWIFPCEGKAEGVYKAEVVQTCAPSHGICKRVQVRSIKKED